MTQDFAKKKTAQPPDRKLPGWFLFISGLTTGVFLSFLTYLWLEVPQDQSVATIKPVPEARPKQETEEMRWDFYDLFPKSEVPIVEEYNQQGERVASNGPEQFLLQAGSFRKSEDADQRRAELILLGLEVFVRETEVSGDDWYRVMVGPLETEVDLNRAQYKLAQASIESIPIRTKP